MCHTLLMRGRARIARLVCGVFRILCAILALGVVALWVRSYWVLEGFSRTTIYTWGSEPCWTVKSALGGLYVQWDRFGIMGASEAERIPERIFHTHNTLSNSPWSQQWLTTDDKAGLLNNEYSTYAKEASWYSARREDGASRP